MTTDSERLWNHAIENEDFAYARTIAETSSTANGHLIDDCQLVIEAGIEELPRGAVHLPAAAYPELQIHVDTPDSPHDTPLF